MGRCAQSKRRGRSVAAATVLLPPVPGQWSLRLEAEVALATLTAPITQPYWQLSTAVDQNPWTEGGVGSTAGEVNGMGSEEPQSEVFGRVRWGPTGSPDASWSGWSDVKSVVVT